MKGLNEFPFSSRHPETQAPRLMRASWNKFSWVLCVKLVTNARSSTDIDFYDSSMVQNTVEALNRYPRLYARYLGPTIKYLASYDGMPQIFADAMLLPGLEEAAKVIQLIIEGGLLALDHGGRMDENMIEWLRDVLYDVGLPDYYFPEGPIDFRADQCSMKEFVAFSTLIRKIIGLGHVAGRIETLRGGRLTAAPAILKAAITQVHLKNFRLQATIFESVGVAMAIGQVLRSTSWNGLLEEFRWLNTTLINALLLADLMIESWEGLITLLGQKSVVAEVDKEGLALVMSSHAESYPPLLSHFTDEGGDSLLQLTTQVSLLGDAVSPQGDDYTSWIVSQTLFHALSSKISSFLAWKDCALLSAPSSDTLALPNPTMSVSELVEPLTRLAHLITDLWKCQRELKVFKLLVGEEQKSFKKEHLQHIQPLLAFQVAATKILQALERYLFDSPFKSNLPLKLTDFPTGAIDAVKDLVLEWKQAFLKVVDVATALPDIQLRYETLYKLWREGGRLFVVIERLSSMLNLFNEPAGAIQKTLFIDTSDLTSDLHHMLGKRAVRDAAAEDGNPPKRLNLSVESADVMED